MKCEPGCTCKRHSKIGSPCPPGCTCDRHDPAILKERGSKISAAKKGRPLTAEHRAALKCPPDCTCDKHTLRNIGQFSLNNPGFLGRTDSEETKEVISKKMRSQMEKQFPGANRRTDLKRDHKGAYDSWSWMKSRCFEEWNASFPRYGGRGITVCQRWLMFENFLADMGDRPEGRVQIGRIDHDKNYEPDNCRWEIQ